MSAVPAERAACDRSYIETAVAALEGPLPPSAIRDMKLREIMRTLQFQNDPAERRAAKRQYLDLTNSNAEIDF